MTHANITNELIIDLNDATVSAIELCTRHGLSIAQLHDIITSPEFVQLQRMLATIERARDTFRLASVTQVLERIALVEPTSPAHAETIRKAAAHLDRQLRKNTPESPDPTTPNPTTPDPINQDPTPQDPQPTNDDTQHTRPTKPDSSSIADPSVTNHHPSSQPPNQAISTTHSRPKAPP